MKKLIISTIFVSMIFSAVPVFGQTSNQSSYKTSGFGQFFLNQLELLSSATYGIFSASNKPVPYESSGAATVSVNVSEPVLGLAALFSVGTRQVTWQTGSYPKGAGVNINLLKKTSVSPNTFILVRRIAENTLNDGKETWIPTKDEVGDDFYIEVTCSTKYQFNTGCKIATQPIKVY